MKTINHLINSNQSPKPQKPDNSILKLLKNKNKRSIKQENLRAQLIRGLKRSIRQVLEKSSKISKKIHNFEIQDNRAKEIWKKLKRLAKKSEILKDISKTEEGPKTDGKSKRMKKESHKSFNKDFCYKFFKSEEVREYFSYYVELVFHEFNPRSLCMRFDIRCCEWKNGKEVHKNTCLINWAFFKDYIENHFIRELELDPIEQNSNISLPDIEEVLKFS